jgi:hypothetical protein
MHEVVADATSLAGAGAVALPAPSSYPALAVQAYPRTGCVIDRTAPGSARVGS